MKKLQFILHVLAIVVLVTGGTIIATSSTQANQYPCCDTVDCNDPSIQNNTCRWPDPYRTESNQTCNSGVLNERVLISYWCNH